MNILSSNTVKMTYRLSKKKNRALVKTRAAATSVITSEGTQSHTHQFGSHILFFASTLWNSIMLGGEL